MTHSTSDSANEYLTSVFDDDAPSAQDCIRAIVECEGDLFYAAEKVFGPSIPAAQAKSKLIATIAQDPQAVADLATQLRTFALLQAFNTARLASVAVDASLENMNNADKIKTLGQSLQMVQEFSSRKQNEALGTENNLNLTEVVFNVLPQEVRDSLRALMAPEPTGVVEVEPINGTWSGGAPPPNAAKDPPHD